MRNALFVLGGVAIGAGLCYFGIYVYLVRSFGKRW